MKNKNIITADVFPLIILSVLFLFQSIPTFSQVDPQIKWQRTIGGAGADRFKYIEQTADAGFILITQSNSGLSGDKTETQLGGEDNWIIKLDSTGAIQWQNTIGGNYDDFPVAIHQLSDGGYIVGCYSNSDSSFDKTETALGVWYDPDFWIYKLDASGAIVWQNTIGGDGQDGLGTIEQTADKGFILAGYSISDSGYDKSENSYGQAKYWVVKTDSLGGIEWDNTIGGLNTDAGSSIQQTADGNYILGGYSGSDIGRDKTEINIGGGAYPDYWILKLNPSGNVIWQNTIGGERDDVLAITRQTPDGGYILGGHSFSYTSGDKTQDSVGVADYWIVKTNAVGTVSWDRTIGGTGRDKLTFLQVTPDGGYIIAGESASNISGDKPENSKGGHDYWIVKLNTAGSIEWQNTIGGTGEDYEPGIIPTMDGGYLLAGTSASGISGDKSDNSKGGDDIWIIKFEVPDRLIHGSVYADLNSNCALDISSDIGYRNRIVHDGTSGSNAVTDANGNYIIPQYGDTSALYLTNLESGDAIPCLSVDTIHIYSTVTSSYDTVSINFPVHTLNCSRLNLSFNNGRLRRCNAFDIYHNIFTVMYDNTGFDTARDAYVKVVIDTNIIDGVISLHPFTQLADSLFFTIGDIAPFTGGRFDFNVHVKCGAVIGSTNCARAYIFPHNNCDTVPAAYDGSDIAVETSCKDDTVIAKISNLDLTHGMSSRGFIHVFEDESIIKTDSFMLGAGSFVTNKYYAEANKTLTLEVHQNSYHSLRPIIIVHDELCGLTVPVIPESIIIDFPPHDEADEYEEICTQILGSYDPNLKSVIPAGRTAVHFTDTNQVLEYRIDFQNTGLDTAFRVSIIDTLNPWLNINTLVPLVASHTFKTEIIGSNILHFIFDPIALPDSNASEPNSHGYVTFKIRPKFNTPKGSIISNFADIYFDYNAAVRTNTIFNTIYDTLVISTIIKGPTENIETHLLVFPNPSNEKFFVKFEKELHDADLIVTDASGREILELNDLNGSTLEMNADRLSQGIYFINVYEKNIVVGRCKIVVE